MDGGKIPLVEQRFGSETVRIGGLGIEVEIKSEWGCGECGEGANVQCGVL